MSKKTNGVNYSMRVPVKSRRARVLESLQAQLKRGTKNTKDGVSVPLEERDIKRINKEMEILKKRI